MLVSRGRTHAALNRGIQIGPPLAVAIEIRQNGPLIGGMRTDRSGLLEVVLGRRVILCALRQCRPAAAQPARGPPCPVARQSSPPCPFRRPQCPAPAHRNRPDRKAPQRSADRAARRSANSLRDALAQRIRRQERCATGLLAECASQPHVIDRTARGPDRTAMLARALPRRPTAAT